MADPAVASRSVMIAIDGPSGSGKSSVSKEVARRLGIGYLDTGAMYRALTWWCLDQGIDLTDQPAVADAAETMPLEQGTDPDRPTVLMAGHDIGIDIRGERITTHVTAVATNTLVRPVLQRRQRRTMGEIADRAGGVVAEGRDITTVVAPDADVRILLTASEEARLRRRATENHGQADEQSVAATRDSIVRRDAADSTVSQFSVAADGVRHIDTSDLSFEESVEAVLAAVAAARTEV